MAEQVEMLAHKIGDPSPVPRDHIQAEGELTRQSCPLTSTSPCPVCEPLTHITHTLTAKKIKNYSCVPQRQALFIFLLFSNIKLHF